MSYNSIIKALKEVSPDFYSAVVVIDYDGKVLLGKRSEDGIWTSPAGGGHFPESPEQAAIRELFEESGLVARPEHLQPVKVSDTSNNKKCYVYLYVISPGSIVTSKLDPDQEVKKWGWYSKEEIPEGLKNDERRFTSVREAFMKFHGISKGGEGSGVKGHRSFHENERDRHYDEALKIQEALQQVNSLVQKRKSVNPRYKIPEEAKEIIKELKGRLDGHKRTLSGHVNQIGRMDQSDSKKVTKSVVAMDNHSGNAGLALDVGAYSQSEANAEQNWIEIFNNVMSGFDYGEVPRDITLDSGYYISLVKTDDGVYSGRVRQTIQPGQDQPLEENVFKVEKQTIPDIIQILKAKQYIMPAVLCVEVVPETKPEEPAITLSEHLQVLENIAIRDLKTKLEAIKILVS